MRNTIVMLILVIASFAMAANWTFMVYLDGDNNLEGAGVGDFNEMESVGSNSDINIVVQFDRIDGYDNSNGDWTDTRRYLVQHDTNPSTMTSTVVENLGEANMGISSTLRSFVQWSMANYPASHYCLVLWNHGSGWEKYKDSGMLSGEPIERDVAPLGAFARISPSHFFDIKNESSALKAVCQDETNGTILHNDDVATALSGIHLDIICADACLQGMLEVAYEWRNNADYIVGSEEVEPGNGYPYDLILAHLAASPSMSAEQLATTIVNDYGTSYSSSPDHKETQSSVRVSSISTLMTALDNFGDAMSTSGATGTILGLRSTVESFEAPNNVDLWDFADKVATAVTSVSSQANAVKTAIDNAVVTEYHSTGHPNVHGLAIYLPVNAAQFDGAYTSSANLDMVADHRWDEFLTSLFSGGGDTTAVVDYYEPNDVPSSAYGPLPEFVAFESYCSTEDDYDYYTFSLGGNTDVGVALDGPDGGEDFDIYLYSYSDCSTPIAYSEELGADEYCEASLTAGQYYILVHNYGSASNNPYQLMWGYSSGYGSQNGEGWLSFDWYYSGGPESTGYSDADAICVYFNPPDPPYELEGVAYYFDVETAYGGRFYPMIMDMYDWLIDPSTELEAPDGTDWFVVSLSDVIVATDFFVGFIYHESGDIPFIGYDDYWSGRDFFYYVDTDDLESYGVTLYIRSYLKKIGPAGVEHYVLDNKQMSSPTIESNFPNPFNSATSIEIYIPENTDKCSVDIFDMNGRKICNLHSGQAERGTYHFVWNGMDAGNHPVPSGSYTVRLSSSAGMDTKQIIFVK